MSLNIKGIKNSIKSVLDAANTTTASYDLSTSLTSRVITVSTISPNAYHFTADKLPAVSIWTNSKAISAPGIVKDQITAKREGLAKFFVAGFVWNSDFMDIYGDSSDDEIETLMENIEEVLRRNTDLSGTVLWNKPTECEYHSLSLSNEQHYKVGILTVECKQLY